MTRLTTRRIDGQFPNVAQLKPETFDVELEVDRGEVLEAVRRAAVMAQRNTPLRLRFAEGELTISAQSQDVGETRESLAVGSRSRSGSTPSSCARASSRSRRTRWSSSSSTRSGPAS